MTTKFYSISASVIDTTACKHETNEFDKVLFLLNKRLSWILKLTVKLGVGTSSKVPQYISIFRKREYVYVITILHQRSISSIRITDAERLLHSIV